MDQSRDNFARFLFKKSALMSHMKLFNECSCLQSEAAYRIAASHAGISLELITSNQAIERLQILHMLIAVPFSCDILRHRRIVTVSA